MDSENSQSGVPCNHAFRDITNTEGREPCLLAEEALTGISGENDKKRRRTFYEGPWNHNKGKNEVVHPPKDFEACKHAKSITLSFMNPKSDDSQSSRGNTESQGECLIDKLTWRDSSSGQLSRLKKEADKSSIGHVPSLNSEADDISTESDELKETFGLDAEQFMRYPVHLIKDYKEPAFSCHSSLGWSLPSKNKSDAGERLTDEKSTYISMCGTCPCSSCTKAAYMWSDLIYQDTRGRLSALKSSRRHTRILEGKILMSEKNGETSQSQLKKKRSTESDLLQHWTSLLLRTEDTLLCEIMQTQSRIAEIENLKDKLKRDLKIMGTKPQNESED
ncbi:hypothetical protein KSP40_PGU007394 [Platanthera guangdongensis]|uniref:Uncharacterized protein n=1 Tax=Platanthera guangdongensis TaxID=2320717 RepID=A0ABR2LTM3_9ASPA